MKDQALTYNLAPSSSLAYSLGYVTFQSENNVIQTVESYPSPSRQWGDVLGVSDDDQSLHVQAGAGIGAASIFLGNGNSQTQHGVSDPNHRRTYRQALRSYAIQVPFKLISCTSTTSTTQANGIEHSSFSKKTLIKSSTFLQGDKSMT